MIFCKVDIFFKTEINILKCITACKYHIIDLYFYIKLIKTTNPNPTAKRTLWGKKKKKRRRQKLLSFIPDNFGSLKNLISCDIYRAIFQYF